MTEGRATNLRQALERIAEDVEILPSARIMQAWAQAALRADDDARAAEPNEAATRAAAAYLNPDNGILGGVRRSMMEDLAHIDRQHGGQVWPEVARMVRR